MKSFCGALFGVSLMPVSAFASEGAKGGLPQMDFTSYPGQVFWLVVLFSFLLVVMRFNLVPRFERTQGKRQKMIESDLARATAARDESLAREASYKKDLAEARAKADVMVQEITDKAYKESAVKQAEQYEVLSVRLSETEARINKMRSDAMKEAQNVAEDLAQEIIKKVSGGSIFATGRQV